MMGRAGLARVQREFTWDGVAEKLSQVYTRVGRQRRMRAAETALRLLSRGGAPAQAGAALIPTDQLAAARALQDCHSAPEAEVLAATTAAALTPVAAIADMPRQWLGAK